MLLTWCELARAVGGALLGRAFLALGVAGFFGCFDGVVVAPEGLDGRALTVAESGKPSSDTRASFFPVGFEDAPGGDAGVFFPGFIVAGGGALLWLSAGDSAASTTLFPPTAEEGEPCFVEGGWLPDGATVVFTLTPESLLGRSFLAPLLGGTGVGSAVAVG